MEKSVESWNYQLIVSVYIMTLLASYLFLPCLCRIGTIKIAAASIIFFVIGLRILLAWKRKEKSNDWKIYVTFMFAGPLFIEVILGH